MMSSLVTGAGWRGMIFLGDINQERGRCVLSVMSSLVTSDWHVKFFWNLYDVVLIGEGWYSWLIICFNDPTFACEFWCFFSRR